MYVPQKYRSMTSNQLEHYVEYEVFNMFAWDVLLMIDYNNHHKDDDYDGGLSFINRIHKKLGWFHTEWNVNLLRNSIKNEDDYIQIITDMLDEEVCCMYGLHHIENGF